MQLQQIYELFLNHGDSEYGGESVTQLEHALQTARLAESQNASAALITAALLHDVGHLLHEYPADAPENGVDDQHETTAGNLLEQIFPDTVVEPVRMHVAAKRYLCAMSPEYCAQLSRPSIVSLELQGGPMSEQETRLFESNPHSHAAILLRGWDDAAKQVGLETPPLDHFWHYVCEVALENAENL